MKKMIVILQLFLIATAFANAEDNEAMAVLKKVEKHFQSGTGSVAEYQMTLGDGNEVSEERTFKLWKSGDKKLLKFISPAGLRGVGLLVLSDHDIYLYLPALGVERRIQSGAKNDSFLGTDFSYNEIGSFKYSDDYNAVVGKKDEQGYTLRMTRKKGSDKKYSMILAEIDKKTMMYRKLSMYNNGKLEKVLEIRKVKNIDGHLTPVDLLIRNVATQHFTGMKLSKIKYKLLNAGRIFSKRNLKKHI